MIVRYVICGGCGGESLTMRDDGSMRWTMLDTKDDEERESETLRNKTKQNVGRQGRLQ